MTEATDTGGAVGAMSGAIGAMSGAIDDVWDELTAAAILGTGRRPHAPLEVGGELGGLIGRLTGTSEGVLLSTAAAVALYARAGYQPHLAQRDAAAICPSERASPIGSGAMQQLYLLLDGEHPQLIPEFARLAAAAGQIAPPSALPQLLDLGLANAALRPLLLPLIGERGRWLARQNPSWGYATPDLAADDGDLALRWQTAERAVRLALAQRLRASDPAAARELVASTWREERADVRGEQLETLGTGLTMADEPLLEAALDDRSKEVRRIAAGLLGRLSESRYAARMAARALALLRWTGPTGGLLGFGARPAQIVATPPSELDAAMARDGLELINGRRGALREAIVAATPPTALLAAWAAVPGALAAAEWADDTHGLLRGALIAAAARYGDAQLLDLLLASRTEGLAAAIEPVLASIGRERRDALAAQLLRAGETLEYSGTIHLLLDRLDISWSADLVRALAARLQTELRRQTGQRTDWQLGQLFGWLGLYAPPSLPELDALLREAERSAATKNMVAQMARTLAFRRELRAGFAGASDKEQGVRV